MNDGHYSLANQAQVYEGKRFVYNSGCILSCGVDSDRKTGPLPKYITSSENTEKIPENQRQ